MEDKEKQIEICDNCKKQNNCNHRDLIHKDNCRVNNCDYYSEVMPQEKQIEEMAKDLGIAFQLVGTTRFRAVAEFLADKWQRKIPKDSVVLSKEELEEKYEPSEKFMSVARELEDLKQNLEDKVVLSREEYKEYKEFKSFMERNDWESVEDMENTLDKCQEVLYERLQQASKETAEKIFKELKVKLKGVVGLNYLDEIAKQCGVEIKE